jgi:hypothetical protein
MLDIDTTIKSGEVKLVLCAQTPPFSEMMRSYKCFQLNLDIRLHYVAYLILIAVMRFSFHHCNGDGVSLRNGVEANANVIVWFEPTRV